MFLLHEKKEVTDVCSAESLSIDLGCKYGL
jgi:hypothetical protein